MESAGALGVAAPILRTIPNPLGVRVGSRFGEVVIMSSFQTKFQFFRVQRMGEDRAGRRVPPLLGSESVQVPPHTLWGYLK